MKRLILAALLLPLPLAAQETDCANAVTQADMNQCAASDLQTADAALNQAFGTAMTRLRALDDGSDAALRKAQRAWITFRDAACDVEGMRYAGGSMQGMVVTQCKTRLTEARTEDMGRFDEYR